MKYMNLTSEQGLFVEEGPMMELSLDEGNGILIESSIVPNITSALAYADRNLVSLKITGYHSDLGLEQLQDLLIAVHGKYASPIVLNEADEGSYYVTFDSKHLAEEMCNKLNDHSCMGRTISVSLISTEDILHQNKSPVLIASLHVINSLDNSSSQCDILPRMFEELTGMITLLGFEARDSIYMIKFRTKDEIKDVFPCGQKLLTADGNIIRVTLLEGEPLTVTLMTKTPESTIVSSEISELTSAQQVSVNNLESPAPSTTYLYGGVSKKPTPESIGGRVSSITVSSTDKSIHVNDDMKLVSMYLNVITSVGIAEPHQPTTLTTNTSPSLTSLDNQNLIETLKSKLSIHACNYNLFGHGLTALCPLSSEHTAVAFTSVVTTSDDEALQSVVVQLRDEDTCVVKQFTLSSDMDNVTALFGHPWKRNWMFVGYSDGTTEVWNSATESCIHTMCDINVVNPVTGITCNTLGNQVIIAHDDGCAVIWSISDSDCCILQRVQIAVTGKSKISFDAMGHIFVQTMQAHFTLYEWSHFQTYSNKVDIRYIISLEGIINTITPLFIPSISRIVAITSDYNIQVVDMISNEHSVIENTFYQSGHDTVDKIVSLNVLYCTPQLCLVGSASGLIQLVDISSNRVIRTLQLPVTASSPLSQIYIMPNDGMYRSGGGILAFTKEKVISLKYEWFSIEDMVLLQPHYSSLIYLSMFHHTSRKSPILDHIIHEIKTHLMKLKQLLLSLYVLPENELEDTINQGALNTIHQYQNKIRTLFNQYEYCATGHSYDAILTSRNEEHPNLHNVLVNTLTRFHRQHSQDESVNELSDEEFSRFITNNILPNKSFCMNHYWLPETMESTDQQHPQYYALLSKLNSMIFHRYSLDYSTIVKTIKAVVPLLGDRIAVASVVNDNLNVIEIFVIHSEGMVVKEREIEISDDIGTITTMICHSCKLHWILTGHSTGKICVWNSLDGIQMDCWINTATQQSVTSLSNTPNNKYLAIGYEGGTVDILDASLLGLGVTMAPFDSYFIPKCLWEHDQAMSMMNKHDKPYSTLMKVIETEVKIYWLSDIHLFIVYNDEAELNLTNTDDGDGFKIDLYCSPTLLLSIPPILCQRSPQDESQSTLLRQPLLWVATNDLTIVSINIHEKTKTVTSVFHNKHDLTIDRQLPHVISMCEMRNGTKNPWLLICLSDGTQIVVDPPNQCCICKVQLHSDIVACATHLNGDIVFASNEKILIYSNELEGFASLLRDTMHKVITVPFTQWLLTKADRMSTSNDIVQAKHIDDLWTIVFNAYEKIIRNIAAGIRRQILHDGLIELCLHYHLYMIEPLTELYHIAQLLDKTPSQLFCFAGIVIEQQQKNNILRTICETPSGSLIRLERIIEPSEENPNEDICHGHDKYHLLSPDKVILYAHRGITADVEQSVRNYIASEFQSYSHQITINRYTDSFLYIDVSIDKRHASGGYLDLLDHLYEFFNHPRFHELFSCVLDHLVGEYATEPMAKWKQDVTINVDDDRDNISTSYVGDNDGIPDDIRTNVVANQNNPNLSETPWHVTVPHGIDRKGLLQQQLPTQDKIPTLAVFDSGTYCCYIL